MGIANDSRGGDSCGVFIDGKVDYGVDKYKLFVNYVGKSDLIYNTTIAQVAMGHDRKASAGYKADLAGAQPCIIKDENDNIVFCVTHNGTIYNTDELAKKYIPEINIKGLTDSQVMTLIFYHKGYDVLEEYNGSAVFIIADYRSGEPEVFFYKGKSKETQYTAKAEDERPLFYTIDEDYGEIVYSSIPNYLVALRPGLTIYTMTPNAVQKFVGNCLKTVKSINRDHAYSKKAYAVQTYQNTYQNTYQKSANQSGSGSFYYDQYISVDDKKNLYKNRNACLNGKSLITRFGKLEYIKNTSNHELWFYNGVCMYNEECWKFLISLRQEVGINNIPDFILKYENVIRYLSPFPVYKKGDLWMKAISPSDCYVYNGELRFLGQCQGIDVKNGAFVQTIIGDLWKDSDFEFKIPELDFDKIRLECKSMIN